MAIRRNVNVIQNRGPTAEVRTLVMEVAYTTRGGTFDIRGVSGSDVKAMDSRIDGAIGLFNEKGAKNSNNPDGRLLEGYQRFGHFAPAEGAELQPEMDAAVLASIMACVWCRGNNPFDHIVFAGEVGRDWELRPLPQPYATGLCAKKSDLTVVCAEKSAPFVALTGAKVIPVSDIYDVAKVVAGQKEETIEGSDVLEPETAELGGIDMQYVKGRKHAKRALEIAVTGGHNMLMVGPPGEGKSLLAKCIPTIAPELTIEQAIETTSIHQADGLVESTELIRTPPLRQVDPNVSKAGLIGGGHTEVHVGEITLAHNGVLYADELLQWTKSKLESLRTAMQDRQITISRTGWKVRLPASFQLIASANPCPCGYWGHPKIECTCTPRQRKNYASKLSGPVVDRLDVRINTPALTDEEKFGEANGEPSADVRERVVAAREMQSNRYNEVDIGLNAELGPATMAIAMMTDRAMKAVEHVVTERVFSTRGMHKLMAVARSIADLAQSEGVEEEHVVEAADFLKVDLPKE